MGAELVDHIHMGSKVASVNLLLLLIGVVIFCYGLFIQAPPVDTEGMGNIPAGITMLFGMGICMVAAFIHFLDEFSIHRGETVAGDFGFWIARVLFVLLALPLLLILVVIAVGSFLNLTR